MSRVGKKEIVIPNDVGVKYNDGRVIVEGEKGVLFLILASAVDLVISKNNLSVVTRVDNRSSRALQGLTRTLIANMVIGVTKGFEKALEVNGVGYKAELKGRSLIFNLGYSHPISFDLPEGVEAVVDRNIVRLNGIDKEKLGQTASSIRQLRPPEPYKGKGIRYVDEYVHRKAGKTGTK